MSKTYLEYKAEIAELEKLAEAAKQKELGSAKQKIFEIMSQYGITPTDLTTVSKVKASSKSGPVAAKYRDSQTGKEWTGRGREPEWIKGKNRDEFMIKLFHRLVLCARTCCFQCGSGSVSAFRRDSFFSCGRRHDKMDHQHYLMAASGKSGSSSRVNFHGPVVSLLPSHVPMKLIISGLCDRVPLTAAPPWYGWSLHIKIPSVS